MQQRIETYIRRHRLLEPGDKVLVAVSGGADSVALLHLLSELGYRCYVAHCNFHLRGEESDRDELFVHRLAESLSLPLTVTHFQTEQYATEQGVSIEMAARDLRYRWFEEERQRLDCEAIAVAHHQNDQAETLIMHLKRGSGLTGMVGMRPRNGRIIRPLLCATRQEIEQYCQAADYQWINDSTNTDTAITRNAIRSVLQLCSEQEIRHMAETADRMRGYEALLGALLRGEPVDEGSDELLYELLKPYGLNASQIADIHASLGESGRRFEARDYVATIDHGELHITSREEEEAEVPTPRIIQSVRSRMPREHFPAADEDYILVDADCLRGELHLRHWQEGDAFYPITSGKPGRKKLQDFFSDLKLSRAEKSRIWLLLDGDRIVWVAGYRLDNRYKITDATTRVAEITLS